MKKKLMHKQDMQAPSDILSQKEVTILIPDANCPSCISVIEKHFQKHHNINAHVNFATKTVNFTFPKTVWESKKIIKELKILGFEGFSNFNDVNLSHFQEHYHSYDDHESHLTSHAHHQIRLSWKIRMELLLGICLLIPLLLGEIPTPFFMIFMNPWWQFSAATIIYSYFGWQFAVKTYREVFKQKRLGMNSLIFCATTVAYFYSLYILLTQIIFHQEAMLFFETTSVIIIFVMIGETISHHLQKKALSEFANLMSLQVKTAIKIDLKTRIQQTIKSELVAINDYLLVPKGAKIPTDGIVVEGTSQVNQAMMTGEAELVEKNINDDLIGGTINQGNPLIMRATEIGQKTILANIIQAVEQVQSQKPQVQKIVDKIAAIFTPLIIGLALLLWLIYFFGLHQSLAKSLTIAITTLVIACPCALGIATPLAIAVGTNKAARQGIIFKRSNAFEKVKKIATICFDKTGTITTGKLVITKMIGDNNMFDIALALESYSTHPIAHAFQMHPLASINRRITLTNVTEITNLGLQGQYQNEIVVMSALSYALSQNYQISDSLKQEIDNLRDAHHLIALTINQKITTIFVLDDEIRPNAAQTVGKFLNKGIDVVMISGDNFANTQKIASQVGIVKYYANVKPIGKAEIVQKIQQENQQVAFVGDGINDTVALEQADLAIAISSGSEIAISSADMVIVNADIDAIYRAIVLTKKIHHNIYTNLAWAFAYNLIALPLSGLGLITPLLATLAMSSSEIFVVANSLFFKLRQEKFH